MLSQEEKQKRRYHQVWFQENKRKQNGYYVRYRDKLKQEVVAAYGGKCISCGESDYVVLVLDHIYDDGYIDRGKGLRGGYKLYLKLKREGWPKDRHQLLCHNCNYRKELQRRRRSAISFS